MRKRTVAIHMLITLALIIAIPSALTDTGFIVGLPYHVTGLEPSQRLGDTTSVDPE